MLSRNAGDMYYRPKVSSYTITRAPGMSISTGCQTRTLPKEESNEGGKERIIQLTRSLLQTLQNIFNPRTGCRLRRPAQLHRLPQAVHEPAPSTRSFALQYLHKNRQVCVFVERKMPADGLVNDHPEGIAVRELRRTAVLESKPLRVDQLRTHPSRSTALSA